MTKEIPNKLRTVPKTIRVICQLCQSVLPADMGTGRPVVTLMLILFPSLTPSAMKMQQ